MLPADFLSNVLPTGQRLDSQIATWATVAAIGCVLGIIALVATRTAAEIGARGWRFWRKPQATVIPLADRRRQQLDAVVHIPHRRAFTKNPRLGKRGEYLWNGADVRR